MSIESLLSKLNIDDAVKDKTLVERVKLGLKLIDDIAKSDKTFRNIHQIAKLITSEYFDFKKSWRNKDNQIISRVVKDCVCEISELTSFYFDANYRLLRIHLLIRDFLMLLCQDESRNSSRKTNATKKQCDEEIKLEHQIISQNICDLVNISYI